MTLNGFLSRWDVVFLESQVLEQPTRVKARLIDASILHRPVSQRSNSMIASFLRLTQLFLQYPNQIRAEITLIIVNWCDALLLILDDKNTIKINLHDFYDG
jgi:hypothetical protein